MFSRNAALQCLFNLPGFADYFLNDTFKKDLQSKSTDIAEEFAVLLKKIRNYRGRPSLIGESTSFLKRAIEKVNPSFGGYDQHDSQEFLKAVLEGINEDCNRVKKKAPYKELKINKKWSIQQNVNSFLLIEV